MPNSDRTDLGSQKDFLEPMLAGDCLRLCEEHSEAWLIMNSGHSLAMQIVKAQFRSSIPAMLGTCTIMRPLKSTHKHMHTRTHTLTHTHTHASTHASTLLFVLAILLMQKPRLVSSCVFGTFVRFGIGLQILQQVLGPKECASVAHGPFGCHLKDKCVLRGEEHLGMTQSCPRSQHGMRCWNILKLRLVLPGVAQGYSSWFRIMVQVG